MSDLERSIEGAPQGRSSAHVRLTPHLVAQAKLTAGTFGHRALSISSNAIRSLRHLWRSLTAFERASGRIETGSSRAAFFEVPWVAQNYSRVARLVWSQDRRAWALLDVWILARAYAPDVRVEVSERELEADLQRMSPGQVRISRRAPVQLAESLQFPDLARSIEEVHLRSVFEENESESENQSFPQPIFGGGTGGEAEASVVFALRDESCMWLIFDSRLEPFRRDQIERVARGLVRARRTPTAASQDLGDANDDRS